jgi:hypothetical protein
MWPLIVGFAIGFGAVGLVALVCHVEACWAHGKPLLPGTKRKKMRGPVKCEGAVLTAEELIAFCATARTYYLPDDPEIAGIEAAIEDDLANGVL